MNGFNIYLHRTMALCYCTPGSTGDEYVSLLLLFPLSVHPHRKQRTAAPLHTHVRWRCHVLLFSSHVLNKCVKLYGHFHIFIQTYIRIRFYCRRKFLPWEEQEVGFNLCNLQITIKTRILNEKNNNNGRQKIICMCKNHFHSCFCEITVTCMFCTFTTALCIVQA